MEIKNNLKAALIQHIKGALNNKKHSFGYDAFEDKFCSFRLNNDLKVEGYETFIEINTNPSGNIINARIIAKGVEFGSIMIRPDEIENMTELLNEKKKRALEMLEREIETALIRDLDSKNRYYGY